MLIVLFLSCSSELDNKTAATVTNEVPEVVTKKTENIQAQLGTKLQLDPSSKIEWVGSKVSGDHRGGFQKVSGAVLVSGEGNNTELKELTATFDMNSLFSDHEKLTKHLLVDHRPTLKKSD